MMNTFTAAGGDAPCEGSGHAQQRRSELLLFAPEPSVVCFAQEEARQSAVHPDREVEHLAELPARVPARAHGPCGRAVAR